MYDSGKLTIAFALMVLAPQVLNASEEYGVSFSFLSKPVLGYNGEGELIWRPSAYGAGKFSAVLPEVAIDEALRYSDLSSLYYLSSVTEENLTARGGPVVELGWEPDMRSLTADWAVAPSFYAGFGASENEESNIHWSLRSRMIVNSTPNSIDSVAISLGEESIVEIQGARLSVDETLERLYFVSFSGKPTLNFSLSYGQRHWNALGSIDLAWAAGIHENKPFASLQLEKEGNSTTGFLRLSAQPEHDPTLQLGLSVRLQHGRWGSWRSTLVSKKKWHTALDAQSLAPHRLNNIPSLWNRDVTLDSLKKIRH